MKYLSSTQLLLAGMLICAFIVRLQGLGSIMLNPDELMHISIANATSLSDMWQRSLLETHPPLGHLLRYFTLPLGDGFLTERIISLIFGMLTIPVFFAIGKRIGGDAGGLLMAFMVSFAPMTIAIAQEVRNYSLFLFLAALTFHAYLRYRDSAVAKNLRNYILFACLACLTHFSGFLLVAILGLDGAWRARRDLNALLRLCLAYLPLLVLAALSYHFFYAEGTATAGWKAHYLATGKRFALDATSFISDIILYFDTLTLSHDLSSLLPKAWENGIFITVLIGCGFWYAIAILETVRRNSGLLPLIIAFWVVSLGLALLLIYPFTLSRHSAYALMLFLLPLAYHASLWRSRYGFILCVALILAVTLLRLMTAQQNIHKWGKALTREDYANALELVQQTVPQGEPVITNRFTSLYIDYAIDRNADFYHRPEALRERTLGKVDYITDPRLYFWDFTDEHLQTFIAEARARYPAAKHLWFFYADVYGWDLKPFYECLKERGSISTERGKEGHYTLFAVPRDAALDCPVGKGKNN